MLAGSLSPGTLCTPSLFERQGSVCRGESFRTREHGMKDDVRMGRQHTFHIPDATSITHRWLI